MFSSWKIGVAADAAMSHLPAQPHRAEIFQSRQNDNLNYISHMAATLRAIEATISADGVVTLAEPVKGPGRAVLTLLVEDMESDEPDAGELEAMLEAEADRTAGNRDAFTSMADLKAKLAI